MTIEVLGDGCSRCREMYRNVCAAVEEAHLPADIFAVNDPEKLASYGVLSLPGLVIDGRLRTSGTALSVEQLKRMLH